MGSTTVQADLPRLRDVVGEQRLDLGAPRRGHHGVDLWGACVSM